MDKFPSVEVLSRYSHPLLPTCCQHRPGGFAKATREETCHETRRPAVSDHPGAPAHPQAADGGRDRGRTGNLETDHLSRHRHPDRTARADPRRSRHGLHPGKGIRPAAVDADARRDRGGRARRAMGGGPRRSRAGARRPGPDGEDRRHRAGTPAAVRAGTRKPRPSRLEPASPTASTWCGPAPRSTRARRSR